MKIRETLKGVSRLPVMVRAAGIDAFRAAVRRPWIPFVLVVLLGGGFAFLVFLLTLPDVEYLETTNPDTTALIEIRRNQAAARGEKLQVRQRWVPYEAIPPTLRHAVRLAEDAAFYRHRGVDYREIWESVKRNVRERRIARGASTITQQLAKNLYLSPEKTVSRKIRELFIVRRLERHLTKARIFHLYLNVIELGPGVFGVEAASRYHYGKTVSDIGLEEIVRLVAVIPRPLTVSPHSDSRWVKWRALWIMDRLHAPGYITERAYRRVSSRFQ